MTQRLEEPDRRWRGHRVRVVDGSSVSMPDTPELQRVFPKPTTQAKGCGFPVAGIGGWILAVASLGEPVRADDHAQATVALEPIDDFPLQQVEERCPVRPASQRRIAPAASKPLEVVVTAHGTSPMCY